MLTTFDLDEYVFDALVAGASGFPLKDVAPEHLLAAIHTIAQGESLLAPSITRRLIEAYVRDHPPASACSRARRAHRPRTRNPHPRRTRPLQRRDRRSARPLTADDQDPRRPHPRQAQPTRPHPGGRPRLRDRHRPPRQSTPPINPKRPRSVADPHSRDRDTKGTTPATRSTLRRLRRHCITLIGAPKCPPRAITHLDYAETAHRSRRVVLDEFDEAGASREPSLCKQRRSSKGAPTLSPLLWDIFWATPRPLRGVAGVVHVVHVVRERSTPEVVTLGRLPLWGSSAASTPLVALSLGERGGRDLDVGDDDVCVTRGDPRGR